MMKGMLLFVVSMAMICAQADVLLWQVTTGDLPEAWSEGGETAYPSVTEARLVYGDAYGSGSVVQTAFVDLSDAQGATAGAPLPIMESQTFELTSLPAGSAQSFYIELYSFDQSGNAVLEALSSLVAVDTLKEFSHVGGLMTNLMPWGGGKFTPVPEPTSGLLMLLGLAGLALRRKR